MSGHRDRTDGTALTRRGLLTAAAGAATAGLGAEARAQAETYRFGGEVAGWRGRAPAPIEGATNPTLELQAGTDYEVVWENLDGAPHDFTIQDSNGSEIVGTEQIAEEGATATLSFTATPEMAQYICTIHPSTMVGDIQIAGGEAASGDGGLPLELFLLAGAMLAAVLSPLAFALFLFANRDEEGRPAPRPGD